MSFKLPVTKNSNFILLLAYVLSFLAFLRLSHLGGGFTSLNSMDIIVLSKLAIRFLSFGLAAFYFIKYIKYFNHYMRTPYRQLLYFLIFALFSILYSSDIFNSSFRLSEHFGYFFFSFVIVISISRTSRETTEIISRGVNLILYGTGLLILIVWSYHFIAPEIAYRNIIDDISGLGGSVIHVHTLATISSIGFGITLHRFFYTRSNYKYFLLLYSMLMVITIYLTRSRTALVVLAFLVIVIIFYHRKKKITLFIYPISGLLALIYLSKYLDDINIYIMRGQNMDDLIHLTERARFWGILVIDTMVDTPIFGYGYQMLSSDGIFKTFPLLGYTISHAHNTFIQTFVGLGLIGISLLFYHIFRAIKSLSFVFKMSPRAEKDRLFELMLVLIISLVSSLTQNGIVGMTTPIVPAYMMAIMLITYHRIQIKSSHKNLRLPRSRQTSNVSM